MDGLGLFLYPNDFHKINDVAYSGGGFLWVHLTHPSKGNGTIKSWLTRAEENKSGMKREMAIDAIGHIFGKKSRVMENM